MHLLAQVLNHTEPPDLTSDDGPHVLQYWTTHVDSLKERHTFNICHRATYKDYDHPTACVWSVRAVFSCYNRLIKISLPTVLVRTTFDQSSKLSHLLL